MGYLRTSVSVANSFESIRHKCKERPGIIAQKGLFSIQAPSRPRRQDPSSYCQRCSTMIAPKQTSQIKKSKSTSPHSMISPIASRSLVSKDIACQASMSASRDTDGITFAVAFVAKDRQIVHNLLLQPCSVMQPPFASLSADVARHNGATMGPGSP
jgi:hypothetical protein